MQFGYFHYNFWDRQFIKSYNLRLKKKSVVVPQKKKTVVNLVYKSHLKPMISVGPPLKEACMDGTAYTTPQARPFHI